MINYTKSFDPMIFTESQTSYIKSILNFEDQTSRSKYPYQKTDSIHLRTIQKS